MATSFECINDLIRDYFQYRNLTSTSRVFENDLLKLPFRQYRADLIIERLTMHINQFEINNLIDYWTQIEQHLLSNLSIEAQSLMNIFKKIRINLYRCYLIHAVQLSKLDKINEFYDRLTKTLQQTSEWTKEWFTLPFIKNPEEDSFFQTYFSQQWNDLFWVSLQNFLSVAFHRYVILININIINFFLFSMSQPLICTIEEENSQTFANLATPKPFLIASTVSIKKLVTHYNTKSSCRIRI